MSLREVVDSDGKDWQVFDVHPQGEHGGRLSVDLAAGWLCFQCGTERRRVVPIPEAWTDLPDERLLELLAAAPSRPRILNKQE